MKNILILTFLLLGVIWWSCSTTTFEEQIKNDVLTKMTTGICDSIPTDAKITNVNIGEIVDIGTNGMTDVTIELVYQANGKQSQHRTALLYLKNGSRYRLAAIGGCAYEMQ